jgi:hypothetical protein
MSIEYRVESIENEEQTSSSKATFFSATCLQKVAFGYVFFVKKAIVIEE